MDEGMILIIISFTISVITAIIEIQKNRRLQSKLWESYFDFNTIITIIHTRNSDKEIVRDCKAFIKSSNEDKIIRR